METDGRERRKFTRAMPIQETVAVFSPTPTLARVRDISMGGVGLEYLEGRPDDRAWSEINLFFSASRSYLPSLPLKLVYDRNKDGDDQARTSLHKRFCGVEFGDLDLRQTEQLESIIFNYAAPLQA